MLATAAAGQEAEPVFPLRPEARERLGGVQELWLDWLAAAGEGQRETADELAADMVRVTHQLGMERLPGLAVAAAAQALGAARAGDLERARWMLATAARLDPGGPEVVFAKATLESLDGSPLRALQAQARGVGRMAAAKETRFVLLNDLVLWVLLVAALSAAGFVGLQMATRGVLLYRDLTQLPRGYVPEVVARVLAVAILAWPLLLPAGLLWLALYWSVLLWPYGSRGERLGMIAVWVFIGALPLAVAAQTESVGREVSRPVRALRAAAAGRLEGDLFSDLALVESLIPDSPALQHLLADVHLRLRQWDLARAYYRKVVDREPGNAAALADLGVTFLYEGDVDASIRYLREAAALAGAPAAAHFNLSRAHTERYDFGAGEEALRQASALDSEAVSRWIADSESGVVIAVAAGLDRTDEIGRLLEARERQAAGERGWTHLWRRTVSLPVAIIFVLPAVALQLLTRRSGNRSRRIEKTWWSGTAELVRRWLLPGVPEAEERRWLPAMGWLAAMVALLALTAVAARGFGAPVALWPAPSLLWLVPAAGLVVVLLARLALLLAAERR